MKKAMKEVFLLREQYFNGVFTLHGTGTRSGTGIGNGMNGFQYIMQKCSHWLETETGIRILCFLLCQSGSLYRLKSRSSAVWISHYSLGLFPENFTVNYRTKKSGYPIPLGNGSKWRITFATLLWTGIELQCTMSLQFFATDIWNELHCNI